MILFKKGNMFQSNAECLVNPVNTVGVMGAGLARVFKKASPSMFEKYKKACVSGQLTIGELQILKFGNRRVINFPTKEHFSNPSQLMYIELGLKKFTEIYEKEEITHIAFPKIGSGLGGLNWEVEVKPLMIQYLNELPNITIEIYE